LDNARRAKRLETAKAALHRVIEIDPRLLEAWILAASLGDSIAGSDLWSIW
jgi:hypothetical protein